MGTFPLNYHLCLFLLEHTSWGPCSAHGWWWSWVGRCSGMIPASSWQHLVWRKKVNNTNSQWIKAEYFEVNTVQQYCQVSCRLTLWQECIFIVAHHVSFSVSMDTRHTARSWLAIHGSDSCRYIFPDCTSWSWCISIWQYIYIYINMLMHGYRDLNLLHVSCFYWILSPIYFRRTNCWRIAASKWWHHGSQLELNCLTKFSVSPLLF